jgi:hypothetical protein
MDDDRIDPSELPPCEKGPEAAARFEKAMREILGVSKVELEKREKAWRKGQARRKRQKT